MKEISILGTRGIPASHGGFETFAEYLALYLVKNGWCVTVYCQEDGEGTVTEDFWNGVKLIHIPVAKGGAVGTMLFDLKATLLDFRQPGLTLVLGYNTAIFSILYRLKGKRSLMNMDGVEWKRQKWSLPFKIWFYINECLGAWLSNHLIADHPEIKKNLLNRVSSEKVTVIPYGADRIEQGDAAVLGKYGLTELGYAILVARAEPENSILEIVRAFSLKPRTIRLVVLGNYDLEKNDYHRAVKAAAGNQVLFLGAIYDKLELKALRFHARFYVHGHQVGGTNPSLIEAMGAGSAVLAHGNKYNRWVVDGGACYFETESECANQLDRLCDDDGLIATLKKESMSRYTVNFTWDAVLGQYEELLNDWLG